MTLADWLDARTPAPPRALRARIRGALAPVLRVDVSDGEEGKGRRAHAEMLKAAEALLVLVVQGDSTGRDAALDLLSADALMTYAFEAAADEPESIAALADAAMLSIGTLASERCQ